MCHTQLNTMRRNTISYLLLMSLGMGAYAAEPPKDAPPPPPLDAGGESAPPVQGPEQEQEPQVTITRQTDQTIEEYRVGGRLYMIKVIPKHGKPYYLVDDRGDGKFSRQDSLDSGVRPPRWVIKRF